MDEKYVYCFVRQDIPTAHQIVQALHAVYQMAVRYTPEEGIPNMVLIGVPDVQSLNRVLKKLKDNQIPQCPWVEPDNDMGFTAVATVPISGEKREVLKNYRLYKDGGAGAPVRVFSGPPSTNSPETDSEMDGPCLQ